MYSASQSLFFATAEGRSLGTSRAISAVVRDITGREATVVGKPSEAFFAEVLDDLGVAAQDAVMVGDDVESDIGGALAAGLSAVLVRTGKFREEVVRASGVRPSATVDSIADVPGLLADR